MKTKLFFLLLLIISSVSFATTHTVTNSGTAFSPATITINAGDSIIFTLGGSHNAVEVSEATWNAGGNTALPGFSVPFGGGVVPASSLGVGTHYYVCSPHASIGMKGKIIVEGVTDIDKKTVSTEISVFPNPSEGIFQVDLGNSETIQAYNMEIFDISGALVLSFPMPADENKQTIDLSSYPKGIYILKVESKENAFTRKIMIK